MSSTFAQPGDLDGIVEVDRLAMGTPASKGALRSFMSGSNHFTEVVHREGKVAGYVQYEVFERGVFIPRIAVRPSLFRTGIGRELITTVHGRPRVIAANTLSTAVSERNLEALEFFQSLGFWAAARVGKGRLFLKRERKLPATTLTKLGLAKYDK